MCHQWRSQKCEFELIPSSFLPLSSFVPFSTLIFLSFFPSFFSFHGQFSHQIRRIDIIRHAKLVSFCLLTDSLSVQRACVRCAAWVRAVADRRRRETDWDGEATGRRQVHWRHHTRQEVNNISSDSSNSVKRYNSVHPAECFVCVPLSVRVSVRLYCVSSRPRASVRSTASNKPSQSVFLSDPVSVWQEYAMSPGCDCHVPQWRCLCIPSIQPVPPVTL